MPVNSFKYVPRRVTRYYKLTTVEDRGPIPWNPLPKPLEACRFTLVTSGGLFDKRTDPPFDLEGEERRPSWGDPSYRAIPFDIPPGDLDASHYHLNTQGVLTDRNVLLPLDHFLALAQDGRIGGVTEHHYSFMGYQGFPSALSNWIEVHGPQVAGRMQEEHADCIFLTTA